MSASGISLFRDNVKRFIAENIKLNLCNGKKLRFPRQLWNQFGEAGLLCVDLLEEFRRCAAPFRCASDTSELFFDNLRVSKTDILGPLDKDF